MKIFKEFEGKTAFVTGAASGMGQAAAICFAEFKQSFAAMVRSLLSGGVTVLMVSHDVEFCARYAHRCALFFDGSISAEGTPRAFFGGNSFYTTSADRMARGLLPHAVTAEDVMAGIAMGNW